MFINYSNHSSKSWSREQINAAQMYGEIIDIPFINVDPTWSSSRVLDSATNVANEILKYKPEAVMCQGEFTFTYALVCILKRNGIKCLSACTNRIAQEVVKADGTVVKESVFVFEGFRDYVS